MVRLAGTADLITQVPGDLPVFLALGLFPTLVLHLMGMHVFMSLLELQLGWVQCVHATADAQVPGRRKRN